MIDFPLERLREICLKFPEAGEFGGVGDPTFKVRDKIFAMQHGMNNRPSLWVKGEPGMQDMLVNSDPDKFFMPPYVGQHGWIGIYLDIDLDWDFVGHLITRSYVITAPKRLSKLLPKPGENKS
jgi:predicted DNA-binding protein (MmcQ/YjbR family)